MSITAVNATGWNELYDGNLLGAAYTMYNTAMPGWFIPILFLVYQFLVYFKTKNITLMFITGFFFVVMYATASFIGQYIEELSVHIMFILLVFEIAGILYMWIMK